MQKTHFVLAFFVAAVVVGLLIRYNVRIPLPARENFMQKEAGMPLNASGMGPYDQQSLGGWSGNEQAMPVGAMPVATPQDSNKLMLMVGNNTSTKCNNSPFSTDTGYVCLSGQELDYMAHRGGNN